MEKVLESHGILKVSKSTNPVMAIPLFILWNSHGKRMGVLV